ncbi:MAG: hypothetical protein K6F34_01220 [Lachnospiraceae bacterium]|nr:hypothetical protein [Lachnospiraceae bacterium]
MAGSSEKKFKEILIYPVFLAISAAFISVFAMWMSPLYSHWYGCDASFFTLVGRGILNGRVPYRDFYDLKGPYFFFLQALGQLIHSGRSGMFLLEIVSLFASLVLIYKTGRLFISVKKTVAVIVLFLWAYASMLWGGNCLEEFSLPLNLLVMYLILKEYAGESHVSREHSENGPDGLPEPSGNMAEDTAKRSRSLSRTAFISGLCFTVMAFSKITTAAPLAGLMLGIVILNIIRRSFKNLAYFILWFVTGAMCATVPLLIYYGINGCILKMLSCTFLLGLKRSSDLSHAFTLETESRLAGVTFSIVFILTHLMTARLRKHYKFTEKLKDEHAFELGILMFPMCLFTYAALHLGDFFIYYYITGVPCIVAALILFLKLYDPLIFLKDLRQGLCWALLIIFAYSFTKESMNTVQTFANRGHDTFHESYYNDCLNMGMLIPECDRDSVFSFDIDMQWFEINGMMPCNKYVVNLQYFIALDPPIEDELLDMLDNDPPKWIICSNTLPDYLPVMDEAVRLRYDCIYQTDTGLVYLKKD